MLLPVDEHVVSAGREADSARHAVVDMSRHTVGVDERSAAVAIQAIGTVRTRRQRDGVISPVDEVFA